MVLPVIARRQGECDPFTRTITLYMYMSDHIRCVSLLSIATPIEKGTSSHITRGAKRYHLAAFNVGEPVAQRGWPRCSMYDLVMPPMG